MEESSHKHMTKHLIVYVMIYLIYINFFMTPLFVQISKTRYTSCILGEEEEKETKWSLTKTKVLYLHLNRYLSK